MDTDTDSDSTDQPQLSGFVVEGEVSNHDQDTAADPDQRHIPEIDNTASTVDDNSFAGPKL